MRPKDIKKGLQRINRNACDAAASGSTQKDFNRPSGVFDVQQTTRFLKRASKNDIPAVSDISRFESVLRVCLDKRPVGWVRLERRPILSVLLRYQGIYATSHGV